MLSSVLSFNISPIKKPEITKKNQIIKLLLKCFLANSIRMIEIGKAINAVLDWSSINIIEQKNVHE